MKKKPKGVTAGAAKSAPAVVHNVVVPLRGMLVALSDLEHDGANARVHDSAQVRAIADSLRKFGQHRPVVFRNSDRVAVVGNGMIDAARSLGWTHVAAIGLEESAAESVARGIADNRAYELGAWDPAALRGLIESLPPALADHAWFGGDMPPLPPPLERKEQRELVPDRDGAPATEAGDDAGDKPAPAPAGAGGPASEAPATDAKPVIIPEPALEPPPKQPSSREGDLWLLGAHRLLCGDSTLDEDVDRLIGRAKVKVVVQDPPYAIYGSSTGIGSDITDDKIVMPFFEALWRRASSRLALFDTAYVFCDWRSYGAIWNAARRTDMRIKNAIVWDKGGFGLGGNYANCYELAVYAIRMPPAKAMTSNEQKGIRCVYRPNIIRCPRVSGDEREHNAQKPVFVLSELIGNSTAEGELVVDFYGGSGSTLIAAERMKRAACVMEIEPKCVDVIVKRWQRETGLAAKLENGKTFDEVAAERLAEKAGRKNK